jgi:putative transposase
VPETITIDGRAASEAAIKSYTKAHSTAIAIRQIRYLNNNVEQDHKAVKRITRPMLGFTSFEAAQGTTASVELIYVIKKRQFVVEKRDESLTAAEQFYTLAA